MKKYQIQLKSLLRAVCFRSTTGIVGWSWDGFRYRISGKNESGEIIDKPAMTLRLSGAGTPVGSAIYNENTIYAKKQTE